MRFAVPAVNFIGSVAFLTASISLANATPISFSFSSQTSVTVNGFVDVISGTFTLDPSITGTGPSDVFAANIIVSSGDPELVGIYGLSNPCADVLAFPGCVDTQDFNQINLVSPSGILGLIFSEDYDNPPPLYLKQALWAKNGFDDIEPGDCSFPLYCFATSNVGEGGCRIDTRARKH